MTESKSHSRQDVEIIRRALRTSRPHRGTMEQHDEYDENLTVAEKALSNLEQQFRSLEEQVEATETRKKELWTREQKASWLLARAISNPATNPKEEA